MSSLHRFWSRWGFAVVASSLGLLLVLAMAASYRAALALRDDLDRGQMDGLVRAVEEAFAAQGRLPTHDELQEIHESQREAGLRYLALIGPEMQVAAETGASVFPKPLEPGAGIRAREGHLAELRLIHLRAPGTKATTGRVDGPLGHRPPSGARGPTGPHAPPALGGPARDPRGGDGPPRADRPLRPPGEGPGGPFGQSPDERRPPIFFVEMEPILSAAIVDRAQRDLAIGVAVALALVFTSIFFGRLARRSERLRDELLAQRELAAVGEMSAVLAHELRNPLTSLKGNAELLVESLPEGTQQRQARRVFEAAGRLERLTEDLLDFVRAGRITARDADPVAVVERAVAQSGAEVKLDTRAAPTSWPIDVDRVEQALVNLLRNAHQAGGGDPVELRLGREGDWLSIRVDDRGPGVPADKREEIFAPFVTSRTRGTGLGLAVVRRVAELHGGRIRVEDNPGGGARFCLELPQPRVAIPMSKRSSDEWERERARVKDSKEEKS